MICSKTTPKIKRKWKKKNCEIEASKRKVRGLFPSFILLPTKPGVKWIMFHFSVLRRELGKAMQDSDLNK